MKIELQLSNSVLTGSASRIFLAFTSPWYSAAKDSDLNRYQHHVSKQAVQQAEVNVPKEFSHFKKWVISRRVDVYNLSYNEPQFYCARAFLTKAYLLGTNVQLNYKP